MERLKEETAMTDAAYSEYMKKKMNMSSKDQGTMETVEINPKETKIGHVTDCLQLNVREHPSQSSAVVEVLRLNDQITVDMSQVISGWVKVKTSSGANGYCMQKYIMI